MYLFCFGENEHFHLDRANICTEEERRVHSVNGPIQTDVLKLKYSPNWSDLTVTKSHHHMKFLSHDHDLYIFMQMRGDRKMRGLFVNFNIKM